MSQEITIVLLVSVSLVFAFLNGIHDASNVAATVIFSRAMSPRKALYFVAAGEFLGPFLFGAAVATTVGKEIVSPGSITSSALMAAVLSAILWNTVTWRFGLPSSSSHALIGGIVGAVISVAGINQLHPSGVIKVAIFLFGTPLMVMLVSYLLMKLVLFLVRGTSPRVNRFFKLSQIPIALALSLSHGSNDAQKTMGIIVMGLVLLGFQNEFYVPLWVVALSGAAISLGTAVGGWRIIKTLGSKIYRVRPIHAFSSQTCSAGVVFAASLLGGPVSGTHVVSSSIVGVGAAERLSKVKWDVVINIVLAWLVTMPIVAGLAIVIHWILKNILSN